MSFRALLRLLLACGAVLVCVSSGAGCDPLGNFGPVIDLRRSCSANADCKGYVPVGDLFPSDPRCRPPECGQDGYCRIPSQDALIEDTPGDCARSSCTNGQVEASFDPSDLPPDDDPCSIKSCANTSFGGFVQTRNAADGTPCTGYVDSVCIVGQCLPRREWDAGTDAQADGGGATTDAGIDDASADGG